MPVQPLELSTEFDSIEQREQDRLYVGFMIMAVQPLLIAARLAQRAPVRKPHRRKSLEALPRRAN